MLQGENLLNSRGLMHKKIGYSCKEVTIFYNLKKLTLILSIMIVEFQQNIWKLFALSNKMSR